jgi:hypothetical protein
MEQTWHIVHQDSNNIFFLFLSVEVLHNLLLKLSWQQLIPSVKAQGKIHPGAKNPNLKLYYFIGSALCYTVAG